MYKFIENLGLVSIIGNFQSNYCILLFQNNLNNDGMMHLAEHYIIKMVLKKRKLSLYGRTDIDYMYLFLRIPESFPYFLLEDINEICNTKINLNEFRISQEEVIREIQLNNHPTLEILNFVSDGFIKRLPVGSIEKVYSTTCIDMERFLKTNILNKFSIIYIGGFCNNPHIDIGVNNPPFLNTSNPPLFKRFKYLSIYSNRNRLYIYFVFYYKSQNELDKYLLFKLIFFKYINTQQRFHIYEKTISRNNKLIYFMSDNAVDYSKIFESIVSFSEKIFRNIKKNLLEEYKSINFDSLNLNNLIESVIMYKCYGDSDIKFFIDKETLISELEKFDFIQMDYFIRKIFNKNYRVIELKKSGD